MTRPSRPRVVLFVFASLLAASVWSAGQQGVQEAQKSYIWDIQRRANTQASSTLTVTNLCRRTHSFNVLLENITFLKFPEGTEVTVGGRKQKVLPVVFDTTGMEPGVYEGNVVVKCLTCSREPTCTQDKEVLPTRVAVIGQAAAPGSGVATTPTPDTGLHTQTRRPCPEDTSPCDELKRRAEQLESEARAARAAADRAAADQGYKDSEATQLDDEVKKDLAYAATLRRQAGEWRQLARDAEADAAKNMQRAQQWPAGSKERADWEAEAARDRARAAERNAQADKLEREAAEVEARAGQKTGRSGDLRGTADAARREAEAKERAAAEARAAYEACLQRLKEECERQRAADAAAAAAAASRAATAASGTGSGPSTTTPTRDPAGPYINHTALPLKEAKFCTWYRYDVPRGAIAERVHVVAFNPNDTPGVIEIKTKSAGDTLHGIGFEYHCAAASGSAVLVFEVHDGADVKKYRMRIACTP